jgi:O-succinylbenzoic acid--CoA ligase
MDWLLARIRATPHKTALIIEERQWSYAQLHKLVDGVVATLMKKGVKSGDLVPVMSTNSLEFVCLVHALARMNAVLVPFNTRLSYRELEWQLDRVGSKWFFCDEAMADRAEPMLSRHRTVDTIRSCQFETASRSPAGSTFRSSYDLDSLQAIVFTSGTTGSPKGAMLTFAAHFWSATASTYRLGAIPEDRWLSCLPLYHVGGLAVIFRSCLYGTAVVLQDGFDIGIISQALERQDITLVSLVPTMLHRLLDVPGAAGFPESLRLVLLGGAAASSELISRCQEQDIPVATTYGLTEAASQVATMQPEAVRRKPGSVGKPLMFTNVRIADETGRTVPVGEFGEVIVSGPTLMSGYYDDATATAVSLRDGELFTGDIGYLDEEGDLWLVQRRSDVIISGGENVYPVEVEGILRQHPAVAAACVVGVNSVDWGQQVAAMIARRPDQTVKEVELIQFCRDRLAGYKIPRLFRFDDHLPQTSSGKIHRQAVADLMNRETPPTQGRSA